MSPPYGPLCARASWACAARCKLSLTAEVTLLLHLGLDLPLVQQQQGEEQEEQQREPRHGSRRGRLRR